MLIFYNQLSNLSGKPQHISCTNNFSLSTSKSNRTWRLSLKGFGIVEILKNGEKRSNEKRAKPRVKIKMIFMVILATTADIPATSACRGSELAIVEDYSEAAVGEPAVCELATDELEKAMATLKPAQKVKPEDAVRDSAVAMASVQEAAYESVAGLLFLNDNLV